MAIYRNISLSFWTDSKVDERFTPEDKYFYLYLLTNPHTTLCGCYEISKKQMSNETGYNTDTIGRLLSRFRDEHGVIDYSEETSEVLIINWSKYNWTKSDRFLKAVRKSLQEVKEPKFRRYVDNLIKTVENDGSDTVSIPYEYGTDTTVTVTVTDTNTDTVTGTGFSESETQELIARAHSGWANRGKK